MNLKCTDIKCFLCPDVDGVLKQLDNELWAHIICVNWNPDIYFIDETKTKVEGVLDKKRFDLVCNMCRKSGKGCCIQCDYKLCTMSYHVRCAVRRGIIKEWEQIEEAFEDKGDDWYIPLFCEKHEQKGQKAFKEGGKEQIISKTLT